MTAEPQVTPEPPTTWSEAIERDQVNDWARREIVLELRPNPLRIEHPYLHWTIEPRTVVLVYTRHDAHGDRSDWRPLRWWVRGPVVTGDEGALVYRDGRAITFEDRGLPFTAAPTWLVGLAGRRHP